MNLVWTILVVVVASLIKGITGFGFALVALPFLIHWYAPKELIPVLILCNLSASLIMVLQKKDEKLVDHQFKMLIAFGAFFTIFGALALKYLPEKIMIFCMGILFIILSGISLIGPKKVKNYSLRAHKIAGAFIGFLTGSTSVDGPPLALFMHSARVDQQSFREIFSWYSLVTATIAVFSDALLGMLTWQSLLLAAFFFPIVYLGSFVGKRLNKLLPAITFTRLSLIMTLVASIILLFK